ncbi:MAG: hypothetical protein ACLTJ8_02525 [Veillonella atypica]
MLYIYDSTELIAQHPLSDKKVNYLPSHYESTIAKTIPYLSSEDVKAKAKSNLEKIGAIYDLLQTNYQRLRDNLNISKTKTMHVTPR